MSEVTALDAAGRAKQAVRERVWALLERERAALAARAPDRANRHA